MKKISKKTITLALSLILCLSVGVGITKAYFTDYESAKGGAVIKLSGQTQLQETMDGNDKTVVIQNVGETDMLVRVQVVGDASKLKVTADSNWVKAGDWYYYKKILKGDPSGNKNGESTTALKAAVTYAQDDPAMDVIVVHEASRTVYETVEKEGQLVEQLVVPNGWDAEAVGQIALQ